MRTLFFGAGPLGSIYAHLLHEAGCNVTVLARGERLDRLKTDGLILKNELTGETACSRVRVVEELSSEDQYDLVVVLIRKTQLRPVFESLSRCNGVGNILFMGNNALGFDAYLEHLPAEKVLFGFPGAGGGFRDLVVHYCDREKPGGKRRAITIGEADGRSTDRTAAIRSLFESAGVPVDVTDDIDGWLKYHVALVSPLVGALYKHDCDALRASKDRDTLRALVRAAKEGGRVLKTLGYTRRQPFAFNLFYWLPEFLSRMAVRRLLASKFAEIAFGMHAMAARDEMKALAEEFRELAASTPVATPNIDALRAYTV